MVYSKFNRCSILLNTTKCLFNYDKINCIITLILTSIIKKKHTIYPYGYQYILWLLDII